MFGKIRKSREAKQLGFLLRELENQEAAGRIDETTYQEILRRFKEAESRYDSEQAELSREAKLRLGRRLMMFFGSAAVCIGIGFLIADHMEWFRGLVDLIQRLIRLLLRIPRQVRAAEFLLVTAGLIY